MLYNRVTLPIGGEIIQMGTGDTQYALTLSGAFRLCGPGGERIDISSKRGQALVAMLAISGSGERTRTWLQDRLWGSRGQDQAQASLRRELSTLKKQINSDSIRLVDGDFNRIWIDLNHVRVDVRAMDSFAAAEFLEGLDIAGEEMFEDWLREERMRLENRAALPDQVLAAELPHTPAPLSEFSARPAIAVLPFVWTPPSPDKEAVAQGISEDLIDRLSKLRWLPVIARSSSFALAGADPRSAGASLSARYIVEGTLRDDNDAGTMSVALTDAETGQTLASNRFSIPAQGDQAAFDALLSALAATLGLKIDLSEQSRAIAQPVAHDEVGTLIWRGRWHLNRLTQDDAKAAREYFDKALALQPNSTEALIQSTWVRLWDLWVTRGAEAEIKAVRQMAQRAIIADYDDARGHMLAGIAEIWLKQPLRAEALLRRAIELNPSLVMAHAQLGSALLWKGKHTEAIACLNFAVRLSPNDHDLFFTNGELASANLLTGDFEVALHFAEQSLARRAAYWLAHVVRINAFVRLDRKDEAQAALSELHQSNSGFRISHIDWLPFLDSSKHDFLKDGLNRAQGRND